MIVSFLKKLQFPKLGLKLAGGPASFVGIDIGSDSVKVVQLRKEREQAILETYGELKVGRYFAEARRGLVGRDDKEVVNLLGDILRESSVTSEKAVFAIPSAASFVTVINFPLIRDDEIESAIPYEAKKYIPIPTSEVNIDWRVIEKDENEKRVSVLLAVVPNEIVSRYQRIAGLAGLDLAGVEIESFSLVRSLLYNDRGVTALVHWGAVSTIITVVEDRIVRLNHNLSRGSREITANLARSLNISEERAEILKKEVGLSDRPEEMETAAVIAPIVDSFLLETERVLVSYNRQARRKVEKIVLAGGGVSLKGFAGSVARHFGLETTVGNPFQRTVFPEFMASVLRDIAPSFGVAAGLALRPITTL
ncbi:MAG: type IV pilus assembly protein PilM [Candidatus Sungbacteria bacterium]|nr:type IV pilus assembly protein PilM [Candidatus Sungbacteria bacterium]